MFIVVMENYYLLVCFALAASHFALTASEQEVGSPLRIAQCRARCIRKFSRQMDSQKSCFQSSDCFMCWENCQLLQANFPVWGGICSEPSICLPGCRQACQFHREMNSVQQEVPVIQTRGEEVVFVKNQTAYWPKPYAAAASEDSPPVVYVVMRRLPGKMWLQISQTLELSTKIPDDLTTSNALLRILVVDGDGLQTIYSPVASTAAESSMRTVHEIARSSGQHHLVPPSTERPQRRRINTEIYDPDAQKQFPNTLTEERGWNLREISLIHQKVLVIAEIAWDAPIIGGGRIAASATSGRPVYFVTWEVDGGGLKGNLFTDSTCVTLSLWPDTIYHIRVELVGHNLITPGKSQQSEDFVLDTHAAIGVQLDRSSEDSSAIVPVDNTLEAESAAVEVVHKRKSDTWPEMQSAIVAIALAILMFAFVLAAIIFAGFRHGEAGRSLSSDLFSVKPNKEKLKQFSNSTADPSSIVTVLIGENHFPGSQDYNCKNEKQASHLHT